MRRYYPYLEDPTSDDANVLSEKGGFLSSVDSFVNQKQYVRMTLLNWAERPLKEIQGEVSSGSISKDGSSPVRRTCSMTVTFDDGDYDVANVDMDFSINKKVFIEVGIKNYTDEYPDYPVLWFPQGVFFVSSVALQNSASSHPTLNITLKDKMCGLNGEVGGVFPSAVILDTVDTQTPSGAYISEKVRIYDILMELVHHYGGEPLENIVIEDVPQRIKKVVRWMGENPLYIKRVSGDDNGSYYYYDATVDQNAIDDSYLQYPQNADVGYVYTDFVYPEELTFNLGDNVCSALDAVKNKLGNYEYYYDVFGTFHFREIKNYLNTTQATYLLDDMSAKDYLADVTTSKSSYSFTDKNNIISLTNSPKYDNIKNDYVIQGYRKGTEENQQIAVRFHLAIDKRPNPGHTYRNLLLYRDEDTNETKAIFPNDVPSTDALPEVGNFNVVYHIADDDSFVYWDDDKYKDVAVVAWYGPSSDGYVTKDWRTELYLEGLLMTKLGTENTRYYNNLDYDAITRDTGVDYSWFDQTYREAQTLKVDPDFYFEELETFWCQVYDLEKQVFYGEVDDDMVDSQRDRVDRLKRDMDAKWDAYQDARLATARADTTQKSAQKSAQDANQVVADVEDKIASISKTIEGTSSDTLSYANLYRNTRDKVMALFATLGITISDADQDTNTAIDDAANAISSIWSDTERSDQDKADATSTLLPQVRQWVADQAQSLDGKSAQYDDGTWSKAFGKVTENLGELEGDITSQYARLADLEDELAQRQSEAEDAKAQAEKSTEAYATTLQGEDGVNSEYRASEQAYKDAKSQLDSYESTRNNQALALTDGNYYLDFIDPQTSGLGEYSVQNIGRRTDAVQDEDVNCLFQPEIPDIIWLETDDDDIADQRAECDANGQPYSQLRGELFQNLATGGYKNGAFDRVKTELWTHTVYQQTVSLTTIPVFHLEPNTRVTINDATTNTYGDYMVTNVSFSLGPGNPMSVNCTECLQKM